MTIDALDLYERLRVDNPADYREWIAAHVPADAHIQTWGAIHDLLKTDALYALANPNNHPQADFDRVVEFLVAAIDSQRIPAYMGISWLGIYVTMADRYGWVIEHPALDPDELGRRALTCLPSTRSEAFELAARLRVEEPRSADKLGVDQDAWLAMRSVKLELEWVAPRIKDPQLAVTVKEWLELICRLNVVTD
ncbi:hypothetical protein AB0G73_22150 [Streptomyces sp. NPDC020719]|uniref:hypothetical protein n=1 Tax=Streptomyces sp. NPDC020719 TaxID=3154896 RepID=UPI0033E4A0C0